MKDSSATVIVELKGKSEKEVLERIDRSRRKNINKAEREGLTFNKEFSESDIKKAYEIYANVWKDGGITPKNYDEWKKLIDSKDYQLFILKLKGKIIGSALIQKITKKFFNLDSDEKGIRFRAFSSDKEYNDYRPNDFLYWKCIKYAIDNKLDFVDLGGWQINARGHLEGVNRFKMQWGGNILHYQKDYPILKAIGRKLIKKSSFFWWLNKKIKGEQVV
ncbi:MAG: peptidoglycan bridge formation glycyltransferase FemA/FemB family protein [Candidatus Pacearchaeota archaeon]